MALKIKYNKLIVILFCCIFTLLCITNFPFSVSGIPEEDNLTVIDENGISAALDANGLYTLSSGSYTVSGTTGNHGISITGEVTVTLHNATIDLSSLNIKNAVPGIDISQGKVSLILEGDNTVKGGSGFAGIYVAEGSSLTLSGQGSLTAQGGNGKGNGSYSNKWHNILTSARCYFGGAAGIGGNGLWLYTNDTWVPNSSPSFGEIVIESGNITAQGGKANTTNAGAGAGIGAGGSSSQLDINYSYIGKISIKNGTVNATGGMGQDFSLTLGGAGIGAGGAGGSFLVSYHNDIKVSISGGTVTAAGTADGAGIGGGANVDGGIIEISGGTVNATGGYEIEDGHQSEHWGGAGIGGGDNGGVTSVLITGNARVTAKAVGAAAGIGAGCDSFVGTVDYDTRQMLYGSIAIDDKAEVVAAGGADPGKNVGGAGIGAGCSYNFDNGFGRISITGQAKVRAYAGARAQAIGVGSDYAGDDPNIFSVGTKSIDVWMFNQDTSQAAFWGQNESGNGLTEDFVSDGAEAVWFTLAKDTDYPQADTETAAFTVSEKALSWQYTSSGIIQLTEDTKNVAQENYLLDGFSSLGNWATFYSSAEIGNLKVSLSSEDSAVTAEKSFSFTVTLNDPSVNGVYGDLSFTNGIATFSLKNGESKTAQGLSAGISYQAEAAAEEGYTITAQAASGIISDAETAHAAFSVHKTEVPEMPLDPPPSLGDTAGFMLWIPLLMGIALLSLFLKKQKQ